ncbi:MAG: hypothetical protein AAF340_08905 [Pseudomonadota bacterium]
MGSKSSSSDQEPPKSAAQLREARLKAALKSNMGRRKAQARARKGPEDQEKET